MKKLIIRTAIFTMCLCMLLTACACSSQKENNVANVNNAGINIEQTAKEEKPLSDFSDVVSTGLMEKLNNMSDDEVIEVGIIYNEEISIINREIHKAEYTKNDILNKLNTDNNVARMFPYIVYQEYKNVLTVHSPEDEFTIDTELICMDDFSSVEELCAFRNEKFTEMYGENYS